MGFIGMAVGLFVIMIISIVVCNALGIEMQPPKPRKPNAAERWGMKTHTFLSGNWGGEKWGGDKKDS